MSNSLKQKDVHNNQEVKMEVRNDDYSDRSEVFIKYYNYYYQMLSNNKNSVTEKSDE